MLSNFTYMRKVGETNLQSQKIDERLPLAGQEGYGELLLRGTESEFGGDEEILEIVQAAPHGEYYSCH